MDKNKILELKLKGKSNRAVAKETGFDRKTVAKYWNEHLKLQEKLEKATDPKEIKEIQSAITAAPKYDVSSRTTRLITSKFLSDLKEILDAEIEKEKLLKTKKQNLTKRQIHALMKKKGHTAGYSTVCEEIDKMRALNKECFIRQKYDYGDRLEYDFGEVHLFINDQVQKLYVAVLSSPASNFRWSFLYDNQKQLVFLDSHVKFFKMTKGVWNEVVYDNMRNVVKKFLGRNEKELNDELVKLATYYGFKINVTNAFRGNEKGHVENSVKYLRNQIFAEKVKFKSFEEAEEYMNRRLFEINSKSKIGAELSCLKQAPPEYEIARITTSKVNKYSFIQVECNNYSVPEYLVGYTVTTKIYHNRVLIYSNNELVCEHKRLKGKGQYAVNLKHYLKTLLKKPGSLRNSVALKSNPKLLKIFNEYYFENPKKFINIIYENKTSSWEAITTILVDQAKKKLFEYEMVKVSQNIERPNHLSIITSKTTATYNNLVIGGKAC